MPYKTRSGTHYHMTEGCHGADIPCSEEGLSPCSDCCATAGHGGKATGAAGEPVGTSPAAASPSDGTMPGTSAAEPTSHARPQRPAGRGRRTPPNEEGCVYVGGFLDADQFAGLLAELARQGVGGERLHRTIACPHVTFAYMPEDGHGDLLGRPIGMTVVAYGNDGDNEGVEVVLDASGDDELDGLGAAIALPHVTISVSEGGAPVNTPRALSADGTEGGGRVYRRLEPFRIEGRFGGFTPDRHVVFEDPRDRRDVVLPDMGDDPASGVSVIDAITPMENPAIPPDGLVDDIDGLASEIGSADRMLVVMRGAAGCGKSTLVSLLGEGATVVCPDEIRLRENGLEPDGGGVMRISQRDGRRIWDIARREAESSCASFGGAVVIDAMHARPKDIRQWERIAERTGRKVVVVDLTDVPRDVSRERNAGRPEWKQVPDSVIDRFYDAAEANTPDVRRHYNCVDRTGFARLVGMLPRHAQKRR